MKKHTKILRGLILLVLLFTLIFEVRVCWYKAQTTEVTKSSEFAMKNSEVVGEIRKGVTVSQSFMADRDFAGVMLYVATYGKQSYSNIYVELENVATGEIVARRTCYASQMRDNSYFSVIFDHTIPVKEKTQYQVNITSSTGRFGHPVTIWSTADDSYKDGNLSINGETKSNDLLFEIVYEGTAKVQWGMFAHRVSLLILLFVFLGLHCILNVPKMYQWIFKNRVWVAIALFIFMVGNKYNFSSMAEFDPYVQPGEGSEYSYPVFGSSRSIRSDEWMVSLPRLMSAEYSDYGEYNSLVRAVKSTNIASSGLYRSYSALAQPSDWGFYLFGTDYGLAFLWNFNMIFGFLFSFEFCLILTKRKKLLSLLGAALIWCSSYNMWWSTVNWMLMGPATLVFAYYFLTEEKRIKRVFFGIGIAVFASAFVVNLYPAWQVPAGYLFLMILIWMFAENWQRIRQYKWKDWMIVLGTIAFLVSIVLVYFINDAEYLQAVTDTVYPGQRVSYGGFSITRLFGYLGNFLMPYRTYSNPSEVGCFVTLFPIPYLFAIYALIRSKKKDLLTILLLIPTTFLGIYCMVSLPPVVAKVLLLTYTTPKRASDILGYAMVLLLLTALGRMKEDVRVRFPVSLIACAAVMAVTLYVTRITYAGYLRFLYFAVIGGIITIVFALLFSRAKEKWRNAAMIVMSVAVIVTGYSVNPLMYGTEAVTSRPVAKEISRIAAEDSEGKWMALSSGVVGNYMVACGAPTINSVNYVPNMEMWKKLDPAGADDEVYNRYAHINIELTNKETTMELAQTDFINLFLSYDDLEKLDVSYLYAPYPLKDQKNVSFKELYHERDVYLYQVQYQK